MAGTTLKISAQLRQATGKNSTKHMRRAGQVPGTVYGHGLASVNVVAAATEVSKVLRHRNLLHLEVAGEAAPRNVVVRELQRDPLTGILLHVDFQEVRMDEKITASVAVIAVGTAVGLSSGGVLEQMLHHIDVTCLPQDLPERLLVDVSGLKLNDSLNVPSLAFPPGVVPAHADINAVVFHMAPPRAEEVTATAEAAVAEPARLEKPKKAEGGATPPAATKK
jgi:large subunit ribosomal protein L25